MAMIEYHQGCNAYPPGCMGPWDNFYTIFGSELRDLYGHMFVSAMVAAALLGFLYTLRERGKIRWQLYIVFLVPAAAGIVFFFLLAYFFPVRVVY